MLLPFILTLILVAIIFTILILITVYRRLYLQNLSYVQHVEVIKEVELPSIGKDWDYDEKHVQSDDNTLIDVSV